jgi:hypothetical protein
LSFDGSLPILGLERVNGLACPVPARFFISSDSIGQDPEVGKVGEYAKREKAQAQEDRDPQAQEALAQEQA